MAHLLAQSRRFGRAASRADETSVLRALRMTPRGGVAGPTTRPLVQWKLPAGYVAEDLLYPAPQRITSGSFANYGYERDVLLLAPIRVPSDAGAGAEISASVRFIVCREVCVPGRAAPSLAMPVGGPAHASRSRALFDATRARVPQRAPAAWTSTAAISADEILVTLTTGRRESGWQFFPLETGIVNDSAAPQYEPIANGLRIHLKRSDQLTSVPERLSFVVEGADGRAFVVSARVAR